MKKEFFSAIFILFLSFPFFGSTSQKKISRGLIVRPKLHIISTSDQFDDSGYPILNVTLRNDSSASCDITQVQFELISLTANLNKGTADAKELKPMVIWNMDIPLKKGSYSFQPPYPIEIDANHAGTIAIRFYHMINKKQYLPDNFGLFTYKIHIKDSDGHQAVTNSLTFGKL